MKTVDSIKCCSCHHIFQINQFTEVAKVSSENENQNKSEFDKKLDQLNQNTEKTVICPHCKKKLVLINNHTKLQKLYVKYCPSVHDDYYYDPCFSCTIS